MTCPCTGRSPHSGIGSLRGAFARCCCSLWRALPGAAGPPSRLSQAPIYVSRIWRTQDGLPENRIRAIAQTPDGYLWVGTSSGLARFDGVRFVVYARFNTPVHDRRQHPRAGCGRRRLALGGDRRRRPAALPERPLPVLRPQGRAGQRVRRSPCWRIATGDVWAGTNRGLFRRHGEKFERVDEPLHLPNIAFFGLRERATARVFAGGPAGLFCFENGKLRPYGPRPRSG